MVLKVPSCSDTVCFYQKISLCLCFYSQTEPFFERYFNVLGIHKEAVRSQSNLESVKETQQMSIYGS